jgi:putative serine protease PepD
VAPRRGGGRFLTVVAVLALMGLAALGGGAMGAWIYAQADGPNATTAGGTTVVDAPQLEYTSLASIASDVSPSVVQIQVGEGSGSGVVMPEDGYIMTNAHVVEIATGDQVTVRFSNGETAQASIVGADERSDIAVVQVEGVSDLVPATFGNSDEALVGDTVLAIGSPLGYQGSVTQGIISAQNRTLGVGGGTDQRRSLSGLLQTDASINPGNSGGALVNLAGEVIGINTAIATDGDTAGFLGLGFAIPSNRAIDVADQLIAGEDVDHAYLGVSAASADTGGALIGEVVPGSPADEAGLQEGDIVVQVDDEPITDSSDLVNVVQSSEPGDSMEVEFDRDGATQTTTVTLADADD